MAVLKRSNARTAIIARGPITIGWSRLERGSSSDPAEQFHLVVGAASERLYLTRIEAERLARDLTAKLADPELLAAASGNRKETQP